MMHKFRRQSFTRMGVGLAFVGSLFAAATAGAQNQPTRGGRLVFAQVAEAPVLTSGWDSSSQTQIVATKIFDGLLAYTQELKPIPRLATSWSSSADGLRLTFNLRQNVKWHDGKPFTSADVAFSVSKVWRELHGRGRLTFKDVIKVETPDAHTAILVLEKPAPYIMNALASMESAILPAHLYEGTDIRTNPANLAPVGTGPFKFKSWKKGESVVLERNSDYWDSGKPYLDEIVFQLIPDASARAAALEAGQVGATYLGTVPLSEARRMSRDKAFNVETKGYSYQSTQMVMEYNLDRPFIKDVQVRKAIAHAIDPSFIVNAVYYGFAIPATGPIHQNLVDFYSPDVPKYGQDLKKANKMLDDAGYAKKADGFRFSIVLEPMPFGDTFRRAGEYVKQQLAEVGINAQIRMQDFPGYVKSIWGEYDYDLTIWGSTNASDPVIGVQRGFLSSNYVKGVPFSNGSHYNNPKVDQLLIAAQSEVDPVKRKSLYAEFQKIAMEELPRLPLVSIHQVTVTTAKLKDHTVTSEGVFDNLASAYLTSK